MVIHCLEECLHIGEVPEESADADPGAVGNLLGGRHQYALFGQRHGGIDSGLATALASQAAAVCYQDLLRFCHDRVTRPLQRNN